MNRSKKLSALAAIALSATLFYSCSKSDGNGTSNPATAETGYCKGVVKDAQGVPIAGAEVVANNHYLSGSNLVTNTNASGQYSIRLGFGTYHASAYVEKVYNGKKYRMNLHPEYTQNFSQYDAVVCNFTWKLSGDASAINARYYGSTVTLDKELMSTVYDPENIEFVLTPVGPLIDGSEGKTLTLKPGLPMSDDYGKLSNIPLGKYTIKGTYRENGTGPVKKVLLRDKYVAGSAMSENLVFEFQPSTLYGDNTTALEYDVAP